jgi:CRP/FNR family transcriptional regulator, cyclic AMP receptor protein
MHRDDPLAGIALFQGLSPREVEEVANLTTRLRVAAGRTLAREGTRGDELLIVLDGTVDVLIDGVVVASPARGECFGEIALLDHRPRTASVVARSDVTVDVISRRDLDDLIRRMPVVGQRLRRLMEDRLAANQRRTVGAVRG